LLQARVVAPQRFFQVHVSPLLVLLRPELPVLRHHPVVLGHECEGLVHGFFCEARAAELLLQVVSGARVVLSDLSMKRKG